MRILFTFVGGLGHLEPLLPFARAARDVGHVIAISGQSSMLPAIAAAGFEGHPSGPSFEGPAERSPMLEPDAEREARDLRDGFADRGARGRAADLIPLGTSWRADLIVCDEVDFGAMIAAERLGVPYASVLVTASGAFVQPDVVGPTLDVVRAEHGLPPDPDMTMLHRYLVLAPFPPSFRDPSVPLPATARAFRPGVLDAGPDGDDAPAWVTAPRDRPLVYVTLGTIFNLESGDLFSRVLEAVRDLPIDVIVTVGRHIDPAEFGPQPDHVRIERFVPQALVVPHCRLVVSHGGSGSLVGALAHGLPSVVLAMGADQLANAARVEALGIGRSVDPFRATPTEIAAALMTVLADDSVRRAAERIRDEIAALPGPETAVLLFEALTER